MRIGRSVSSLCAALVLALAPAVIRSDAAGPSPGGMITMTVHADRPGPRVSPTLYGIFFEEINHAGDGGLYAELVRNRSFAEMDPAEGKPTAWSLRTEGAARGVMALDPAVPLSEANPRSLRLDVTAAPSGRV